MRALEKLKASDAALAADLDVQTKQRSTEQQLREREEAMRRSAAERLRSLGAVSAADEELFSDLLADAAAAAAASKSAGALSPEQGGAAAALSPASGTDNNGTGSGVIYTLTDGVVLGSDGEPLSAAALTAQRKLAGLIAPAAVPGFGVAGCLLARHWNNALLKLRATRRARMYWKSNMPPPPSTVSANVISAKNNSAANPRSGVNVGSAGRTTKQEGTIAVGGKDCRGVGAFELVNSVAEVHADETRPKIVARLKPPQKSLLLRGTAKGLISDLFLPFEDNPACL